MDLARPSVAPVIHPPRALVGIEGARDRFDATSPIVARVDLVELKQEKRLALSRAASRDLIAAVDAVLANGADIQPIVNRSTREVVRMLTAGDSLRTRGRRTNPSDEVRLGITASTSGPGVVYGSVHISSTLRDAATGASLVNTGQTLYGPVAIVLKPATLDRATLSPRDSLSSDHLLPPEALSRAFAESITHRAMDIWGEVDHRLHPLAAGHALTEGVVRDVLTRADISEGSATDPSTAFLPGIPEAQFYGGIGPADIREIRLAASPPPSDLRAIQDAAARWNIPVVMDNKRIGPGQASEWTDFSPQWTADKVTPQPPADPAAAEAVKR